MAANYVSTSPFAPPPIVFRCRWGERLRHLELLREFPPAHPFLTDYYAHHVEVEKVETDVIFRWPSGSKEPIKDDVAEIRVWFAQLSWVVKGE